MNILDKLSRLFAIAGVVLAAYAIIGRFLAKPTILGYLIPSGVEVSSAITVANTSLLIAILAHLYNKR